MRKQFSSIALLVILMLSATLEVASATGNVTINDFNSTVTRGTVPFSARLTGDVTGNIDYVRWDYYCPATNHLSYSSGINSPHTFGAAGGYGVFNVTLVVSGPGGTDSLKKIDYVVGNKNTSGLPVASFSASTTSGDAPLKVKFTDSSKNASSILWYFGLTDSSKEKSPEFTFNTPGTYRVVQEVKNSRGYDAIAKEIIVTGEIIETVKPVAAFEADTSNGLNVQFLDTSQDGVDFSWNFGDNNISSEFSPMHTYSSIGNYTVQLTVSNENGTSSATKTINVNLSNSSSGNNSISSDNSSSDSSGNGDGSGDSYGSATVVDDSSSSGSSSGGSGGSGGGGSPEPQENVEAKELSQTYIGSGQSVIFAFPQKTTPVTNISFNSKRTAGKTTTIVEMLKNQSTLVSEPPVDEVYKFINIWVGNSGFATPDNIENTVVEFKVEKSWIQDKQIDKASITLNRFNDSKWDALSTKLSGEDDNYLYFTAQTTGFSSFAITGKTITSETSNVTQTETKIVNPENNTSNNTSNATNVNPAQDTQSPGTKLPGFEGLIGILGLLGAFLYRRKC